MRPRHGSPFPTGVASGAKHHAIPERSGHSPGEEPPEELVAFAGDRRGGLDPARLPPLPDQAVDLYLRQPRRLGQEAPHRAIVTLAKPLVTKPSRLVPDERVCALPVPVFTVHGLVAFHEGPNLPDAA